MTTNRTANTAGYTLEFFGPDSLYRVSTSGDETLVDVVIGLGYRHLRTITGPDSHTEAVALVESLLK